jgi:hypothetical protein
MEYRKTKSHVTRLLSKKEKNRKNEQHVIMNNGLNFLEEMSPQNITHPKWGK